MAYHTFFQPTETNVRCLYSSLIVLLNFNLAFYRMYYVLTTILMADWAWAYTLYYGYQSMQRQGNSHSLLYRLKNKFAKDEQKMQKLDIRIKSKGKNGGALVLHWSCHRLAKWHKVGPKATFPKVSIVAKRCNMCCLDWRTFCTLLGSKTKK